MFTVKSVMTQRTDPELILQRMSDTLRKSDPKFVHEDQKYFCAVDVLNSAAANGRWCGDQRPPCGLKTAG